MLDGIFEINSFEIDDILGSINNTDSQINDTNDEAGSNFICFKQSGVFSKGITQIQAQMGTISSSLKLMNKAIQRGKESAFSVELSLGNEISSLEIPKDFAVNNDLTQKTFKAVSLKKNDGKSVTNGIASSLLSYDSSSTINNKEKVFSLKQTGGNAVSLDDSKLNSNNIKIFKLSDIEKAAPQIVSSEPKISKSSNIKLFDISKIPNVTIKAEVSDSNKAKVTNFKEMKSNFKTGVVTSPEIVKSSNVNLKQLIVNGQTFVEGHPLYKNSVFDGKLKITNMEK